MEEENQRTRMSAASRIQTSTPKQELNTQRGEEAQQYYVVQLENESHGRMGETEEMFRMFTSSMTQLLQRFTEVSRQPRINNNIMETFESKVEEDPINFIAHMEQYMSKLEVTEDTEKIAIIRAQLKGEARRWADTIRNAPITYTTFKQRFIDEFNSPRKLANAYHQLYAVTQKKEESAEEFISFKQALLARLKPNMSQETTVEIIISLLKPALASRVIGTRPRTLEELVRDARLIENEVEREYKLINTERKVTNQPAVPTTPCRWCQDWHYSNTCSKNPYNSRNQGNVQRPEATNSPQPAMRRGRENLAPGRRDDARKDGPYRNNYPENTDQTVKQPANWRQQNNP